jgi:LacI family transcriptional regulator
LVSGCALPIIEGKFSEEILTVNKNVFGTDIWLFPVDSRFNFREYCNRFWQSISFLSERAVDSPAPAVRRGVMTEMMLATDSADDRPDLEKRVGIAALAQHLGLSVSTVSRALNGYTDVNDETRARVLDGARQLNYSPNAASLRLRHGKSYAIGLIVTTSPHRYMEPFYIPLLSNLDEGFRRHGYDLMVSTVPQGVEEDGFFRRLVSSRRVDVAILTRTRRQDSRIAYLKENDFSFVTLGMSDSANTNAYVGIDTGSAARVSTERLIGMGHTRIAAISGPSIYSDAWNYMRGYRAAMSAKGLSVPPDYAYECEPTEENGVAIANILFDLDPRPTAIICNSDLIAWGVTQAANARGIVLGSEIALIGCDNSAISPLTKPPITTFLWPQKDIADALIAAVFSVINGETPQPVVFQPALMARESDGKSIATVPNRAAGKRRSDKAAKKTA